MATKTTWITLYEGAKVHTGINSQMRTNLVEADDKSVTGIVTLRKWAKYLSSVEKQAGLTKEDVDFKPTTDGVSFPVSAIPEVIADLKAIYELSFGTSLPVEQEKPASTAKASKSKTLPASKTRKKLVP